MADTELAQELAKTPVTLPDLMRAWQHAVPTLILAISIIGYGVSQHVATHDLQNRVSALETSVKQLAASQVDASKVVILQAEVEQLSATTANQNEVITRLTDMVNFLLHMQKLPPMQNENTIPKGPRSNMDPWTLGSSQSVVPELSVIPPE